MPEDQMSVVAPQGHPFIGEVVTFVTKHEKELIVGPLLSEVGLLCRTDPVDTDQFGTFVGDIERKGTVRETLRRKIQAARSHPNEASRFVLASEGSFSPHPIVGLIPTNSLLLFDRKENLEICADYLSTSPVNGERVLGPRDDFRAALRALGFPEHGVIVRPETSFSPIFKGLHRERDVAQAMIDSFRASQTGKVRISSDLRALHNPTRQEAIFRAGCALMEKVKSLCPDCSYPGFSVIETRTGLACGDCGRATRAPLKFVLACGRCRFSCERDASESKSFADPADCSVCNP